MLTLVRRFLAITVFQALIGVVTGAILARTLGPAGRGIVASVAVPLGVLPFILSCGLPTFVSRTVASGGDLRETVGTASSLAVVVGLVAIMPCLAIFSGYAGHDHAAHNILRLGILLLPVTLVLSVISDAGLGLQLWGRVAWQRIIPTLTALVGYLVLVILGRLTPSAVLAVVLAGGLLSVIPFAPVARAAWPPRLRRRSARGALRLSGFAWLIQTSQLLNHRLDQILMAPLVPSRELGLYAVAVTASGVSNMLSSAINTVVYPKIAAGEAVDLARALRRGLAGVALSGLASAAAAPLVLPLVFGSAFRRAVPMLWILLVANLPLAGAGILASVYAARGRIALASMSEVVALAVTAGGLLAVLPAGGGTGAATVSLVAYTINFGWLLIMIRQDRGGSLRDYLVPTREDARDGYERTVRALANRGRRSAPVGREESR